MTHPARRTLSTLRTARRCARSATEQPGVAFARTMLTGTFRTDMRIPFVPGRVAVMLWSRDEAVLDEVSRRALAPLEDGARERWRVVLRPANVRGTWAGFSPDCGDAPALRSDEPVVVMIYGILRSRYFLKFVRDNAAVGRQLATAEGYLGGLGLADTPLTTCSFSCWRTARDSRAFAFGAGTHRTAYKIDEAEQRHTDSFFVRFRPVRSAGTFEGRDPLAAVLAPARANQS